MSNKQKWALKSPGGHIKKMKGFFFYFANLGREEYINVNFINTEEQKSS